MPELDQANDKLPSQLWYTNAKHKLEQQNQAFAMAKTMEDKLDVAYEIYTKTTEVLQLVVELSDSEKEEVIQLQTAAKDFMRTLLNAKNDEEVIELAQERKRYKVLDSAYFPKSPIGLNQITPTNKAEYQLSRLTILADRLAHKSIMRVNDGSRFLDAGFKFSSITMWPNEPQLEDIPRTGILVRLSDDKNTFDAYWRINTASVDGETQEQAVKKVSLPMSRPEVAACYAGLSKIQMYYGYQCALYQHIYHDVALRKVALDFLSLYQYKATSPALYFTHEERAKNRVIINEGKFYQPINGQQLDSANSGFKLCDTTNNISHGKHEYVAYTINQYGEISITSHLCMSDRIAHSSLNAGAAVFGAGELRIINGQLTDFVAHSGHYRPTIENVGKILNYLVAQGVDISQVQVRMFASDDQEQLHIPNAHKDDHGYICAAAPDVMQAHDELVAAAGRNLFHQNLKSNLSSIFASLDKEIELCIDDIDQLHEKHLDKLDRDLKSVRQELVKIREEIKKAVYKTLGKNTPGSKPRAANYAENASKVIDKLQEKFDAVKARRDSSPAWVRFKSSEKSGISKVNTLEDIRQATELSHQAPAEMPPKKSIGQSIIDLFKKREAASAVVSDVHKERVTEKQETY